MSNRPKDSEFLTSNTWRKTSPFQGESFPGPNPGPDRDVSDGGGDGFMVFLLVLMLAGLAFMMF